MAFVAREPVLEFGLKTGLPGRTGFIRGGGGLRGGKFSGGEVCNGSRNDSGIATASRVVLFCSLLGCLVGSGGLTSFGRVFPPSELTVLLRLASAEGGGVGSVVGGGGNIFGTVVSLGMLSGEYLVEGD